MRRLRPVAPGVLVATSRRDVTTTTVVLGARGDVLLVDPAWTPDELDGLAADLAALAPRSITGFSTHAHFDHLLWHPRFGPGPRCASAATVALARAGRADLLAELGTGFPRSALAATPPVLPLAGGRVPWPGPAAELVVTDAHAPGHASLWFPRRRLLVAGDLLSDVEVPLLDDADASGSAYRAGLEALAPRAAEAALVVPGHGRPTRRGAARVAADLAMLDALDAGGASADPRLRDPVMRAVWARTAAARGLTG